MYLISNRFLIIGLILSMYMPLAVSLFAAIQVVDAERAVTDRQILDTTEHEIEVISMDRVILLKGSINGHNANVLFDTGSWPNAIGIHLKPQLSGQVKTVYPAGKKCEVCQWENLTVGNFKSGDPGGICLIDLSPIKNGVGIEFDAIAGSPFMYNRVISVDFEQNRFRLHEKPNATFESATRLEIDNVGRPWIALTIGNRTESFLIDTGFEGAMSVNKPLSDFLKLTGVAKENGDVLIQAYSDGVKTIRRDSIRIEEQTILGYEFRNMEVTVSDDEESANKIGLGLLKAFHLSLDMTNGILSLNRNRIYLLADGCTVLPK